MKINRKSAFFLLCFILIFILAGCSSRDGSKKKKSNTGTLSNKMPVILAPDIVSEINDEIDYLANLTLANASKDSDYNTTVNSSNVDINVAGEYSAIYMVEYSGGTISKQISVTIVEELEEETVASIIVENEKNSDIDFSETTSIPETSKDIENQTSQISETTGTAASETTTRPASSSSGSQQIANSNNNIPNANIILSDGGTLEVENSANRYIIRTFSDESYSERDGGVYLTSELKVEFNTGEIQLIETVVTRIK